MSRDKLLCFLDGIFNFNSLSRKINDKSIRLRREHQFLHN